MSEASIHLDENHVYRVNGVVVPGVTGIISATLGDVNYSSQWHMERGSANHACYAMLARGTDFDYDPRCQPWIDGWRKWTREVAPTFIDVERSVYSAQLNYAGTLDVVAGVGGIPTVIDYKNSHSWRTQYQLAAYAIAWEAAGNVKINQGAEVIINGDGSYKMRLIKGGDWRLSVTQWKSIINVYGIIERNGQ